MTCETVIDYLICGRSALWLRYADLCIEILDPWPSDHSRWLEVLSLRLLDLHLRLSDLCPGRCCWQERLCTTSWCERLSCLHDVTSLLWRHHWLREWVEPGTQVVAIDRKDFVSRHVRADVLLPWRQALRSCHSMTSRNALWRHLWLKESAEPRSVLLTGNSLYHVMMSGLMSCHHDVMRCGLVSPWRHVMPYDVTTGWGSR